MDEKEEKNETDNSEKEPPISPESSGTNNDDNADKVSNELIEAEVKDPNIGMLKPRNLTEEMKVSYLEYAMSVIVSRALPDVRDGLKPVHRRVLYAMYETGLHYNSRYRKCAAVVGEVLKSYHPHGDTAVYDTLVRMTQDFSMRYQMVDGQGNFGSMDGDSAAAMRYTEFRMSAVAEEMLLDIDKDTVDWQDNYDGTTREPIVLPARAPQLLLNGSMGIAVGMATHIPPHNLTELCDGVIHLIDNPEASVEDLMEFVKGPDFPTGGTIYNIEDIKTAYATGKGKIVMRAKAEIGEKKRGFRIVITEIPYQVNKASLIEKIAELVKSKRIDGIFDLRDESDRDGVRVVIELKASAYPQKVLNRLYELTPMQTAFHVNMLALTPDLEPRVMTLRDILEHYVTHRQNVITRRTKFELKKARDRAHILEGLRIALANIDKIIETIKKSQNRDAARINLKAGFKLSDKQAEAILEMRLSALAALERQKIEEEYKQILERVAYFEDLLAHPEKILSLIKDDLEEVKKKYGDDRRTEIVPHALGQFSAKDLIPNQQVIVAFTRGNYIKRQEENVYHKQIRGGKGILGMATKEEDIVEFLSGCHTHDDIYFFTNKGRIFKSKVYELPATSRQSRGTPVVNIIQIGPEEKVTSILTVGENNDGHKFFVMGTKAGMIKRTEIEKYNNIRLSGILAMGLDKGDELRWAKTSSGEGAVVEVSEKGLAISYLESEIRPMGRSAGGVRGIKLRGNDNVMAMEVVGKNFVDAFEEHAKRVAIDMLIVLENGFGKRSNLKNFHLQKRGGMGIKAANCTDRTGNVIGMHITYSDKGDVVLASNKGQFIRVALKDIKRLGRDTQGVTLMRLNSGDKVSTVALIEPEEEPPESDSTSGSPKNDPPKTPRDISIVKNQPIVEKREPIDIEPEPAKKSILPPKIEKKNDINYWGGAKPGEKLSLQKESSAVPKLKETEKIEEETLIKNEQDDPEPETQKMSPEQKLDIKINTYKSREDADEEFRHHSFDKPKDDEMKNWGKKTEL